MYFDERYYRLHNYAEDKLSDPDGYHSSSSWLSLEERYEIDWACSHANQLNSIETNADLIAANAYQNLYRDEDDNYSSGSSWLADLLPDWVPGVVMLGWVILSFTLMFLHLIGVWYPE